MSELFSPQYDNKLDLRADKLTLNELYVKDGDEYKQVKPGGGGSGELPNYIFNESIEFENKTNQTIEINKQKGVINLGDTGSQTRYTTIKNNEIKLSEGVGTVTLYPDHMKITKLNEDDKSFTYNDIARVVGLDYLKDNTIDFDDGEGYNNRSKIDFTEISSNDLVAKYSLTVGGSHGEGSVKTTVHSNAIDFEFAGSSTQINATGIYLADGRYIDYGDISNLIEGGGSDGDGVTHPIYFKLSKTGNPKLYRMNYNFNKFQDENDYSDITTTVSFKHTITNKPVFFECAGGAEDDYFGSGFSFHDDGSGPNGEDQNNNIYRRQRFGFFIEKHPDPALRDKLQPFADIKLIKLFGMRSGEPFPGSDYTSDFTVNFVRAPGGLTKEGYRFMVFEVANIRNPERYQGLKYMFEISMKINWFNINDDRGDNYLA